MESIYRGIQVDKSPSKASKSYETNRICSQDGCSVILSRYNKYPFCSIHIPEGTIPYPLPNPSKREKEAININVIKIWPKNDSL